MWQLIGLVTFLLTLPNGAVANGMAPAPSADITCGSNGENTMVSISDITDIGEWIGREADWQLNDVDAGQCEPTFDLGAQRADYKFNITNCSTVSSVTSDSNVLNYTFIINATRSGNSPVVAYDHLYAVVCSYYRNGTTYASFIPLHDLSDDDAETLALLFAMGLYADPAHTVPLGTNLILGYGIHAQVSLTHQFPLLLNIALERCYLSTDQAGLVRPYLLIYDSCVLESQGANVTEVTYDCENQNGTTKQFWFIVVRYPYQDNNDPVFVHCDVYACLPGDTSPRCADQCANCSSPSGRRRRDVETLSSDKIYTVTSGPYTIIENNKNDQDELPDAENEEQDGEDEASKSGNLMIALAVSGVVAIAIVCVTVLIVLRKRGKKIPGNETVASGMAMENPACEARDINKTI